ncbi:putative transposase [Novosphingobium resinovorum]|uniref:Putative transposase n=1 Tax=Novosphingobium resinovorum TaxID=158500 RepID=A0A031K0K4_9SPHN|nr:MULTISPECIES: ISNCY family transposase [Sphingomonadaceae]EZP82719.1 putative transposase [Novosphingobium resinovorum]
MTVLAMSHSELSRYDTLLRVTRRELRVDDAAMLLGVSRRQISRLLMRLRADGAEGLVSRKRGKPSNRRHKGDFRERVMAFVRENYADFGPTLASEYLAERHDVIISRETLRKWMIEAGLWQDREARRPRPYQPRYRRDCRGELIQVDGSKHHWFEDRGPQCTLLVYIDDATSELMHLRMVESESTFAYMEATRAYIETHGKPVAFYSDKHCVFRNNTASARGDGMTHFGRALEALNIEIICANSPQAKGRVERANATLQDRLVKAMRLEGIATIAEANAFLPGYMARHNQRFAKAPFDARDLHRPLASHEDLHAEMVWREWRSVTRALTLHYNKAMFILEPTPVSRPLAGKRVEVCEFPDGTLEIRHEGTALPYRMFDKIRQVNQAAIVENKHLDAALLMAKLMQEQLPPRKRNNNEPRRRDQAAHLFCVPEPVEEPVLKRKRGRPPLRRLTPDEIAQRLYAASEGAHC